MPEYCRSGLPIWYPVVFAFAAGIVARPAWHFLIFNHDTFNHDTLGSVNAYPVAATTAWTFGSSADFNIPPPPTVPQGLG